MTAPSFYRPVTVFVGLGFPIEIDGAAAAHALLADWPLSKRDAAHEIALGACRAALNGNSDAQGARAAFVTFARRHRILGHDEIETIETRTPDALPSRVAA